MDNVSNMFCTKTYTVVASMTNTYFAVIHMVLVCVPLGYRCSQGMV